MVHLVRQASSGTFYDFSSNDFGLPPRGVQSGACSEYLAVSVATLSTILSTNSHQPLNRHPKARSFLKGALNLRPQVVHHYPAWELSVVLRVLSGSPFEPVRTSSLRHLSLKTAFLIAITSSRRVSELAALLVREDLCLVNRGTVVLQLDSSFIPKVKSYFHRAQEVVLPDFCPRPNHPRERRWHTLDVRRELKRYIKWTISIAQSLSLCHFSQ